jgi:hypothetical protein
MDFLLTIELVFRFSATTGDRQKIVKITIFKKSSLLYGRCAQYVKYRCTDHSIVKFGFSAGQVQVFRFPAITGGRQKIGENVTFVKFDTFAWRPPKKFRISMY